MIKFQINLKKKKVIFSFSTLRSVLCLSLDYNNYYFVINVSVCLLLLLSLFILFKISW